MFRPTLALSIFSSNSRLLYTNLQRCNINQSKKKHFWHFSPKSNATSAFTPLLSQAFYSWHKLVATWPALEIFVSIALGRLQPTVSVLFWPDNFPTFFLSKKIVEIWLKHNGKMNHLLWWWYVVQWCKYFSPGAETSHLEQINEDLLPDS